MSPQRWAGRVTAVVTLILCGAWSVLTGHAQTADPSPAERQIAIARKVLETNPKQPQPYTNLAVGLARRARETGDPSFYTRADEALTEALTLDPANLDAKKWQVWVLLGKHEFARARDAATALNKQVPDDVLIYGFVADANVELGNYKDAEKAVQWMVDMRPANLSGFTRTASLRELFGDNEGALDAFKSALDRLVWNEVEDRAWVLSQMGHLYLTAGRPREAEIALQQALVLFPRYHYAVSDLAALRVSQKRYGEAVELLRDLIVVLPRPEHMYALAEALELAKRPEAKQAYADFEKQALAESASQDNANRELTAYYADHANNPREALRVAELERSRRHDVYTVDAYAWALAKNGSYAKAQAELQDALAVGIQNAEFFYHAAVIASKLGNRSDAVRFVKQSLDYNPSSRVADSARALQKTLNR